MDATDQTADQVRSVKRGRPRKGEGADAGTTEQARPVAAIDPETQSPAQVLALRIWNGQSPDAPIPWRVERIVSALQERCYQLTGVTLPDADAQRHINAAH